MIATSTADVARGSITATIDIDAPPQRVFDAFTDPHHLERWWGSDDTYRTFDWKVDLRPGGQWSCSARSPAGGQVSTVQGEYLAVDPPRALEYTWSPSWDGFATTRVRIEFQETPTGTHVVVHHGGFTDARSCDDHANGWIRVLGWLAEHAASGAA
jgi:uncharacterized protein YndB with AHSA1/START domain